MIAASAQIALFTTYASDGRMLAAKITSFKLLITFRVRRNEAKCISVTAVCVYVCLPVSRPTLLHGPGCKWGNGRGCPLVVHPWADLQSVHGFRCYDTIAPNAKCQRVLVLALCLVTSHFSRHTQLIEAPVSALPWCLSDFILHTLVFNISLVLYMKL